jgi:hypothetical protein
MGVIFRRRPCFLWLGFPERSDISQAGDLRFTGIARLNAPPSQPEDIHS